MTFGDEVDYIVKTEAQLKGTSIKTAEARIAKRLGVVPSTVQRWRYRKRVEGFKPRSKTPRGVSVENSVRRSYLRLQKQKAAQEISREPPTLHVVCSPGGGAFSAYMFLRYALAQRTEKSDVKMTMFCPKEKDGSFKAETWWNKWCQQHELRQKLGFPKGWRPVFLYSDTTCEFKQTQHDTYVYILAGGERAQLIDSYLNSYKSGKQTLLVAEEDLVKLENGSFLFNSVIAGGETSEQGFSVVDTDEALLAIETAIGPTFSSAITDGLEVVHSKKGKTWTCTFGWNPTFSFENRDVSRLHVVLSPLISNEELKTPKDKFSNVDAIAEYFRTHLNKFRVWKKSMRMRLNDIPEDKKKQIEERVPDAKKIFSDKAKDRSKFFPISSFVFRSDKPPSSTTDEVYWLTWDPRNLGRSIQQLSLALSSLESNQSIVLTNFNVEENKSGDYKSVFLSSLEKIQESRGDNIWSKGLKHISAQSILTKELISDVRKFDSIRISEVGLNGPSLKQILESIINTETLTAIKLIGKSYFLGEIPAKISFDQHHEAFARGVFSLGKETTQNLRFEGLHKSPFQQEKIARYLIWLETPYSGNPDRNSPLPGNRWCTLDRNGQLIRVWDEFSNTTLEMLLYLSMECLRNLNGEKNRLLLPEKNGRYINHNAYSQQNPELWGSTITQQEDIFHYFADAKALDKETSREHLEEISIEGLFSKYAWETLEGPVPAIALSFFGTSPSSRQKVPYLYDWIDETEYPSLRDLTRGIDLANFGNYLMKFMAKNPEEIGSYQESMKKERLIVKFPRITSPNFQPAEKQTHLEFFRENSENYQSSKSQHGEPTSQAEDRTYAGVFYNNQHPLGAFHFYDEPIEQCAIWALEVLELQDLFSVEFDANDTPGSQNKGLNFIGMDGIVCRKISVSEFLRMVDLQRLEKYLTSDDNPSTYAEYKEKTGLMAGWPEVKLDHITAVRRQKQLEHMPKVRMFEQIFIVPIDNKNKNPYSNYLRLTEGRVSSSSVKGDREEIVGILNEEMRSQSADLGTVIAMLNRLSSLDLNPSDFEWRVKITDFQDNFNAFSSMVKKLQSSLLDAMFAVHQMAENRPMQKTSTKHGKRLTHQNKVMKLYDEAKIEMKKSGSTINWNDFLTVFRNYSFDPIFSTSSKRRYLRYMELKAKRSSQSSQSDE